MIDGHTGVFALFGDPVSHTFSPMLHRIFIEKAGCNYTYVPFHVHPEGLEAACRGAWSMHIQGLNVTIPHKQAVMQHIVHISREALLAGAVNTLRWTSDGYEGDNTDVYGFRKLVEDAGIHIRGEKVLILGAGGASRSAITYAIQEKASEIVIYNRTQEKAAQAIKGFQERGGAYRLPRMRAVSKDELLREPFPIVFQTTAAGMTPNIDETPVEEEEFLHTVRFVADMVYTPKKTRFCRDVEAYGAFTAGGLPMLYYQGLRSFEIWTGLQFSEEDRQEMYESFVKEMEKRK